MKRTLLTLTAVLLACLLSPSQSQAQVLNTYCILDDVTGVEFKIEEIEPTLAQLHVVGSTYYQDYPANGYIFHNGCVSFGQATYDTQQPNGMITLNYTIDTCTRRATMQVIFLGQHFYYADSNIDDSVCDGLPPVTIPQLSITGTPLAGKAPLLVRFTATATDPDGILSINWNFGDGTTASGANVSKLFTVKKTYNVTCRVTDRRGTVATKSLTIKAQ